MPLRFRRFPRAATCLALGIAVVFAGAGRASAERTSTGVEYHRITFPVDGPVTYTDDFNACREGCTRRHMGNDLLGHKLEHEVAASDGTIAWAHLANTGTEGNMLQLTGKDGWVYWYIHINNDTPGTDDGKNPARWQLAPGIHVGSVVKAGEFIAYMGDSGDAESTQPHLHFEIHPPNSGAIDPYTSLRLAQGLPAGGQCNFDTNPAPDPSPAGGTGYWTLGADGSVLAFGGAHSYGEASVAPGDTAVALSPTSTGHGYWITDSRGDVTPFGDAKPFGSTGSMHLNAPIIGMTTTRSGNGYWLLARDGGIFTFGDAKFEGSTGAMHLNAPIIAMATTQSGDGYWLLASDGGVFTFGDAQFYGSTGAQTLNAPVIGMGRAVGGHGYWLLAADGGMFSFGKATFHGSVPGMGTCADSATAVAFTSTATGSGYWVVLADGTVLPFGDAEHYGDAPATFDPVAFAVQS